MTYRVPEGIVIQTRRLSLVGPCAFDPSKVSSTQFAQLIEVGHVVAEDIVEAPRGPKARPSAPKGRAGGSS